MSRSYNIIIWMREPVLYLASQKEDFLDDYVKMIEEGYCRERR